MMPYRATEPAPVAPPPPDLTFRRARVGLFTAPVIAIAAMVLLLPLPLFALPQGLVYFRNGGWGMFLLVAVSIAVAVACAVAGTFAVRGHRLGTAVAVAVPIVPAVLGIALGAASLRRTFAAGLGIDADPDLGVRILAAGLGESDVLPAYGCLLAAIACGASACALLGGGATVDRRPHAAPAGKAWTAPLVLGMVAFLAAVALRLVFRTGGTTLLLVVPSIVMTTGLACAAAFNAPLVREWREPREADRWVATLLAAALLAGGGLALLEIGAAFLSEARGLGAISGEAVDPSQRAMILALLADEQQTYRVLAAVDGLFAFVVVATVGLAGLGRGANGKLRVRLGAPVLLAFGGMALVALSLIGARSWAMGRIEQAAQPAAEAAALELPRVPLTPRVSSFSRGGAVLRIDAEGKQVRLSPRGLEGASSVLVVMADRRAQWGDVARAIRATRGERTSVEIKVTLLEKADRSQLGPYGALLGNETATITVALEGDFYTAMRPSSFEIMDAIAAAIARRPAPFSARSSDVSILPPEGSW
jgi:hypothetical protein